MPMVCSLVVVKGVYNVANSQPQPQSQQPIFANELNSAIDRLYARMVVYVDARIDALGAQMRVFREESIARDTELREGIKALADAILKLGQRMGTLETQATNIEARMTNIEKNQQEMMQLIRDLHAQTMGAINDLRPKDIE